MAELDEYRRLADTHAGRAAIEQAYEDGLIEEPHAVALLAALDQGPTVTCTAGLYSLAVAS
jgi:hypothetical protein